MSVVTERLWKEKTDVRCERLSIIPEHNVADENLKVRRVEPIRGKVIFWLRILMILNFGSALMMRI